MGIHIPALKLTTYLWKGGYFHDFKSVIEIGSQDIHANQEDLAQLLENIVGSRPGQDTATTPEILYKSMGFGTYRCIDADGRHDSLLLDLNEDFRLTYGFKEQFDLVTNHGTSEHCFDQCNVFRNTHNLCAKGGIIIHGLPFQGVLNHGFFNYQPSLFYHLANANKYDIIGMHIAIDRLGDIIPYSDELLELLCSPPIRNMLLFVVLQKSGNEDFKVPYDGRFLETCQFKDQYQNLTTPHVSASEKGLLRSDSPNDIRSMPTRGIARVLLSRIVRTFLHP